MNKHKMLTAIAVGTGALALLTGCTGEGTETMSNPTSEVPAVRTADLGGIVTRGTITVDGSVVPCVTWFSGFGSSKVGGFSCNWAAATPVG